MSEVIEISDLPIEGKKTAKEKLGVALKYIMSSAVITTALISILVAIFPALEQIKSDMIVLINAAVNIGLIFALD